MSDGVVTSSGGVEVGPSGVIVGACDCCGCPASVSVVFSGITYSPCLHITPAPFTNIYIDPIAFGINDNSPYCLTQTSDCNWTGSLGETCHSENVTFLFYGVGCVGFTPANSGCAVAPVGYVDLVISLISLGGNMYQLSAGAATALGTPCAIAPFIDPPVYFLSAPFSITDFTISYTVANSLTSYLQIATAPSNICINGSATITFESCPACV
jgi:hypothetical protein